MKRYDYYAAVKNDVKEYIENEVNFNEFDCIQDLEEHLNEVLWTNDSVTGNGSGSYTFSTWEAEENLLHNLDLLQEAVEEFGYDHSHNVYDLLLQGPEAADVTIRCYLLSQVIGELMDEIEDDFNTAHEEVKQ